MKCPHDSSRWELSGGELTGFGRDSGDGGVLGGLGGIMGWLAPVGGDLLPSQRKEGTADATFSPKPAPAAAVVGRQWVFRFMFRFV